MTKTEGKLFHVYKISSKGLFHCTDLRAQNRLLAIEANRRSAGSSADYYVTGVMLPEWDINTALKIITAPFVFVSPRLRRFAESFPIIQNSK